MEVLLFGCQGLEGLQRGHVSDLHGSSRHRTSKFQGLFCEVEADFDVVSGCPRIGEDSGIHLEAFGLILDLVGIVEGICWDLLDGNERFYVESGVSEMRAT